MKKTEIISVTGTKGKTTVVSVVSDVLSALFDKDVLHVTTSGHYVNKEKKSTLQDSLGLWGLVPTVCPGRFLYECNNMRDGSISVLEAALGSSGAPGIGYKNHKVGVFLNVFMDHIGSSDRINSQEDIVKAKDFVFRRVVKGGWVVYNADDDRVMSAVDKIADSVNQITFGYEKDNLSAENHVYVEDGTVFYRSGENVVKIIDLVEVVWTFNGAYMPSGYNLMAVIATVIAYNDGVIPEGLTKVLYETKLDPYNGRLTLLGNDEGIKIIADYAHEEQSLKSVASLAKKYTSDGGKVIGIVRLAYDRTDEHIKTTAEAIAGSFDEFIVYDKIDGHYRHPKENLQGSLFVQEVGRISEIFSKDLRDVGCEVETVLREDNAIQLAASKVKKGDVVVHIVNDDIKRSVNWLREYFGADFQ